MPRQESLRQDGHKARQGTQASDGLGPDGYRQADVGGPLLRPSTDGQVIGGGREAD